jgi:NADH-quinone oxidoreductase subunit N
MKTFLSYFCPAIPEGILLFGIIMVLLFSVLKKNLQLKTVFQLTIMFIFLTFLSLFFSPALRDVTFDGQFINDSFGFFVKVIICLISIIVLLNVYANLKYFHIAYPEFAVLFLIAVLGMFIIVSCNDLLSTYISLELQSIALYILVSLNRDDRYTHESAIKFYVLSAIISAVLLYGISLVYGYTGSTNFNVIEQVLSHSSHLPFGLLLGIGMIICGLAFKVSAVPFHVWTPDVFQGTSYPVLMFISNASKLAGVAILMRILIGPFYSLSTTWQPLVVTIAVLSFVFGSLATIMQTNIKRFIAYSAIHSVGFTLIGLAMATEDGIRSSLFYTLLYSVSNMGLLSTFMLLIRKGYVLDHIEDLRGVAQKKPFLGFLLTVFILSMAGLPPFPGFFGKLFLIQAIVESEFYAIAIILVVSIVILAYYYLNLIKVIFFDEYKQGINLNVTSHLGLNYAVIAAMVVVIFMTIFFPKYLLNWSGLASSTLFYA